MRALKLTMVAVIAVALCDSARGAVRDQLIVLREHCLYYAIDRAPSNASVHTIRHGHY